MTWKDWGETGQVDAVRHGGPEIADHHGRGDGIANTDQHVAHAMFWPSSVCRIPKDLGVIKALSWAAALSIWLFAVATICVSTSVRILMSIRRRIESASAP